MSKNAAAALLRRLLAVRVTKELIQLVAIRDMCQALPASPACRPHCYDRLEHHLEPRINRFTIADSEWLRYLYGYQ